MIRAGIRSGPGSTVRARSGRRWLRLSDLLLYADAAGTGQALVLHAGQTPFAAGDGGSARPGSTTARPRPSSPRPAW
ncbi:hypothetical protein [Catellatospora sichuanensis]|uniref:hypothetical protein n=1 Tax=Catellatospora sichuanensis TaxID=1969805 RepID=UPI0011830B37|nr:hypothetical protein [Catellatospora sichuanensis]